jgi:hypothetical protein
VRWWSAVAVVVSAIGLAQPASAATAEETFADTVGDAQLGIADICNVTVGDANGTIVIRVSYADRSCATAEAVLVELDADRSAATGSADGIDYVLSVDASGRRGVARWNGSTFQPVSVPSLRAGCDTRGFDSWSFRAGALGVEPTFRLRASSCLDPSQAQCGDVAPNDRSLWTYRLTPPPPPPTSLEDASTLPKRERYAGVSIRHARLASAIYETMKVAGGGRQLQVACWSKTDWPSVVASTGGTISTRRTVLVGFWHPKQPRFLHLSPKACADVQALIATRKSNGQRAAAAAVALHETAHMYGVRNEAQANCYGVQLVYYLARELRFPRSAALRLERLAVRKIRSSAPRGYWDSAHCSDGGEWDLDGGQRNLDY